jgi:hypothetical protein
MDSKMTEDDVFEAVRALVAHGEYLDEIPGVPGTALSGGGTFRSSNSGLEQRLYTRGSPEHLAARAAGLVDRLPALRTASPHAVAEAEGALGRSLPPLLRRLYLEVGNGGFGPGYGVLGVASGHRDDTGKTAVSLREGWKGLPPALLPICHWGCAIYSFIDLSSSEGRMWGWDPNPVPNDQLHKALFRQELTFADWLGRWTEGQLFQPTAVQDSTTGEWRGATDDEMRAWMEEHQAEERSGGASSPTE